MTTPEPTHELTDAQLLQVFATGMRSGMVTALVNCPPESLLHLAPKDRAATATRIAQAATHELMDDPIARHESLDVLHAGLAGPAPTETRVDLSHRPPREDQP